MMPTERASSSLLVNRSPTTHKYQQGHLLLIVGSEQYAGAAILAGLGARSTGVEMLSIAVPKSLKYLLSQ
jgi:ADP-dependent NAD(P)H-hydrate dehydratase / NAD(P)H-hydrate epimerase